MTTGLDSQRGATGFDEPAPPARLIVCERRGTWAVALRRFLPSTEMRVYETRSLAECWEMLALARASFVVAELTRPGADELLDRMLRLSREHPLARVAVVAERALAPCEWLTREAGAVHFAISPRDLGSLAHLAARHLEAAPKPALSLVEQIWARLPWQRHASTEGGTS
jgi:DNA-binding NtrC family response regulator